MNPNAPISLSMKGKEQLRNFFIDPEGNNLESGVLCGLLIIADAYPASILPIEVQDKLEEYAKGGAEYISKICERVSNKLFAELN